MVEFFELVASYWKKSKEDWNKNRHRLYTLFAFVLIAYLVLEFGSYIFTSKLHHERMVDEIRTKFMDRRVDLADEFLHKFFELKETTRQLFEGAKKANFDPRACAKLQEELKIVDIETDLFIRSSNLRYFFGDEIGDEFSNFIQWYDKNNDNCFQNVKNVEQLTDEKTFSIRKKMWIKMYPPEIIKGIR